MIHRLLKYFVAAIVGLSLLSGLPFILGSAHLTSLMVLSLWGVNHLLLWQPLTYMFVYPATQGLHAAFLITLAFNMFMLWRLGLLISFHKGLKHFLAIFLGAGLFAGLIALAYLFLTGATAIFAGTTPAIFALLMATIIVFPDMEIMLFLTFPMKARRMVLVVLAAILLIDLSNGFFLNFFADFAGMAFGYLYATYFFTSNRRYNHAELYDVSGRKVYDFKTGRKILGDQAFLDACLAKISREGRSSLTLTERLRLWRISRKLAQHNHTRGH